MALLAAALTFIAYLPALSNGFINWDDHIYVYENPHIRTFDLTFLKNVWGLVVSANWHPLTLISHSLDYMLWGLNPRGHHLTSVLLHSVNTALVFSLSSRMAEKALRDPDNAQDLKPRIFLIAFTTALLFGIHPMHVESVAWVSERKDVLCAFFFLLSALAYLRYTCSIGQRAKAFYAVSILSFSLALMSKPMAVTLPAVLLIMDCYPLRRFSSADRARIIKTAVVEKMPFLTLSLVSASVTIWAQHYGGALQPLAALPLDVRLLVATKALAFYLYKIALPLGLSPIYPYPQNVTLKSLEYLGYITLIFSATLASIFAAKRWPALSAGMAYFVVTLLPVLGVLQVGEQPYADRYAYLPSIGPFLMVGALLSFLFEKLPKKGLAPWALMTLLLFSSVITAGLTARYIAIWKNSITFWSYTIELYPGSLFKAYSGRAKAYYGMSDYALALKDINMAIGLNPLDADAFCDLGNIHFALKDYVSAIKDYNTAIGLKPDFAMAYYNSALVYSVLGRHEKALEGYSKARELGIKTP